MQHPGYRVSRQRLLAIERAGATQILERAYSAFGCLTGAESTARPWWEVFGVPQTTINAVSVAVMNARYRELARKAHPDTAEVLEAMRELNRARDEMRQHYAED